MATVVLRTRLIVVFIRTLSGVVKIKFILIYYFRYLCSLVSKLSSFSGQSFRGLNLKQKFIISLYTDDILRGSVRKATVYLSCEWHVVIFPSCPLLKVTDTKKAKHTFSFNSDIPQ